MADKKNDVPPDPTAEPVGVHRGTIVAEPAPVASSHPGPPPLGAALSRAVHVRPADPIETDAPPVLGPPKRTVIIYLRDLCAEDDEGVSKRQILDPRTLLAEAVEVKWLPTQTPLGKPILVPRNKALLAVYAGLRITSIGWSAGPKGETIVSCELYFAPFRDEETRQQWQIKYLQDKRRLRLLLMEGLEMILSRIDLAPGLVLRFVGGPLMAKGDATAHRYQYWEAFRSPTRIEIDRSGVAPAEAAAVAVYRRGRLSLGLLPAFRHWLYPDDDAYRVYLTGKRIAERSGPPSVKVDPKILTAAAEPIGEVVSSLSAVVMEGDPDIAAALADKGRGQVRPTVVGRRSFFQHEEDAE